LPSSQRRYSRPHRRGTNEMAKMALLYGKDNSTEVAS
jgi:hypothetical protein